MRHAVVHAEGRSQEILDRYLEVQGIRRHVVLSTPHFLSIPAIISRSDLVVTVPHAVGMVFAVPALNIRTVLPPFTPPGIELRQHWHVRHHKDPRLVWVRQQVSEPFIAKSDEWRPAQTDDCWDPACQGELATMAQH